MLIPLEGGERREVERDRDAVPDRDVAGVERDLDAAGVVCARKVETESAPSKLKGTAGVLPLSDCSTAVSATTVMSK
jgi:predicted trehalose synthase